MPKNKSPAVRFDDFIWKEIVFTSGLPKPDVQPTPVRLVVLPPPRWIDAPSNDPGFTATMLPPVPDRTYVKDVLATVMAVKLLSELPVS